MTQSGRVRIRVTDVTGAVIPSAEIVPVRPKRHWWQIFR